MEAGEGWIVYQMDVNSTLLKGNLEEEVYYVEKSPGFMILGSKSKVCQLWKAVYGLKQALRIWYHHINPFFTSIGLERSYPFNVDMHFFCKKGK